MKNKKLTAIISGVCGACLLVTGAAAGYKASNGYDALKKSLIATQDYRNCTINFNGTVYADGEETIKIDGLYEADLDNNITHRRTDSYGTDNSYDEFYYYGDSWYYRRDNKFLKNTFYSGRDAENLWGISNDDRETVDKVIHFMELAADTVVGDLRNNFTCSADESDYTSYTVSLDSVQIPEIINAGLSMLFSMSNDTAETASFYDENGVQKDISSDKSNMYYYTTLIGDDPIVDNVTLNFTLDKNVSFRDASAVVTFIGDGHTISFDMSLSFSDIGTTHIETLEEQGADIIDADKFYQSYHEDTEANEED